MQTATEEHRDQFLAILREYPRLEFLIMELSLMTDERLKSFFDQPFVNIHDSIFKVNVAMIGAFMKRASPHIRESVLDQLNIEWDRKDYKVLLIRLLKYIKDEKLGVTP